MKLSPLGKVKERFGQDDPKKAKAALVEAVKGLATADLWIDRVNEDKGFEHISNEKLLHLHDVLTAVKDKFSTRGAMIDEILKLEKREKDTDYRTNRLEAWPTPRLWDHYRVLAKKN